MGEAYPFHPGDRFLLTFDNHNSVNGIREFARARGAETTYIPSVAPDLRVDEDLFPRYLSETSGDHHNLFAFPAQSNFSGVQHPLEWIAEAHSHGWDVLLDAAAFVPDQPAGPEPLASRLRGAVVLQDVRLADRGRVPDRTARGAREARASVVLGRDHRRRVRRAPVPPRTRPARRTSKTAPSTTSTSRRWRSACGICDRIGIDAIHARVAALGGALLDGLVSLRHSDGSPATTIYGPRSWERRGATIAFNFLHPDGRVVDERYVDRVAARHNVSLRTGCFCNPGAGEVAFTISRETLLGGEFGDGMTLDDYMEVIGLPTGGAVRASLGIASNSRDVAAVPCVRLRVHRPRRHAAGSPAPGRVLTRSRLSVSTRAASPSVTQSWMPPR